MVTLAIIGATGAVGLEAIKILNQRPEIRYDHLLLFASKSSAGKKIVVRDQVHTVLEYKGSSQLNVVDYVILATSAELSKTIVDDAPQRVRFIDNSSAFRMNPNYPLVIPQINIEEAYTKRVIANPNCSTIIMLMALYPLHKKNKIKSINVSTYQASSGAGLAAMNELEHQAKCFAAGIEIEPSVFKTQYLFNAFSHNSRVDPVTGYNGEEIKMIKETHKIMGDDIEIDVGCVRIPTLRVHMEDITVEFEDDIDADTVREILSAAPGVVVQDDVKNERYPEVLSTTGRDDVFVGRIRGSYRGPKNKIHMLVTGDQLRKGAAQNALEIYEKIV